MELEIIGSIEVTEGETLDINSMPEEWFKNPD